MKQKYLRKKLWTPMILNRCLLLKQHDIWLFKNSWKTLRTSRRGQHSSIKTLHSENYSLFYSEIVHYRSSHPEVFLGKGVLKICSKFTGEHPCRSAISIKLLGNFIRIVLRHGCSPANSLHIFRKSFLKNTSGWLLLALVYLHCIALYFSI